MAYLIPIFLLVIVVSFVYLLVCGDNKDRTFQKVIGGFAVFVVALYSSSVGAVIISLFIGGLIIASEDFMKAFVGILRADSKDIKGIIQSGVASLKEIEEKEETEQKEIENILNQQEISKPSLKNDEKHNIIPTPSFAKRRDIETKVAEDLSRRFGFMYEPHPKVLVGSKEIIFDGILKEGVTRAPLRFHRTATAVEIKYIRQIDGSPTISLYHLISTVVGRIWSSLKDIKIMLVLVGDDISKNKAQDMYTKITNKFPQVIFGIYSYNTNTDSVEERVIGPTTYG